MKTHQIDPEDFLMAGGRLSLEEWVQLSDDEQKAFVAAGKRVFLDRLADEIADTLVDTAEDAVRETRLKGVLDRASEVTT